MTRSLTVPAGLTVTPGATIWLVRDADLCTDRRHYILRPTAHNPLGTRRNDVHDDVRCANPCGNAPDGSRRLIHQVPVEFVAAAAPCETCGDKRESPAVSGMRGPMPCTDCRIELVGTCPIIGDDCGGRYHPLGWGYAIGQPLPIVDDDNWEIGKPAIVIGSISVHYYDGDLWHDITAALAHYGDPAGLIGKWALRVQVTT